MNFLNDFLFQIKVEPPDIEEVEVIDPLSDSDHAEENNVKIDLPKPKRRIRIPDSISMLYSRKSSF